MEKYSKKEYVAWLATYIKRREETKKKHQEILLRQAARIKFYRHKLETIEERENKLEEIVKIVYEFTGCKFWKFKQGRNKKIGLARRLYYKVSLERGFTAKHINEYIGLKNKTLPCIMRREFTASFSTNRENLETWNRFKQFMKEKQEENEQTNR